MEFKLFSIDWRNGYPAFINIVLTGMLTLFLATAGCSQHPNPPPKPAVEVTEEKSALYGLNPRRNKEYWKIFEEKELRIKGARFECLAGIPILYTSSAEFEILPKKAYTAWDHCLDKVDKIQEEQED